MTHGIIGYWKSDDKRNSFQFYKIKKEVIPIAKPKMFMPEKAKFFTILLKGSLK
jgi:hypothetical protein